MTKTVSAEPVLIIPAWIMKYYILDLSPEIPWSATWWNTAIPYSWCPGRIPTRRTAICHCRIIFTTAPSPRLTPSRPSFRDRTFMPPAPLGRTLLAIAAATLARKGDERLKTMTLLAAQTDFTEAGELMLFIDDAELSFLDDLMWSQGFLETRQMAGTFQLLRSNDLIWSLGVHEYLMGERAPMTDPMAWNADGTRMPARMHSEYLHSMFLRNDLAEGRYAVDGVPVTLEDIKLPVFAVGTETTMWRPGARCSRFTFSPTLT